MAFEKVVCVIPWCDDCGPDWWQNDSDAEGPPHFASPLQARRNLAAYWGWRFDRQIDGRLRMTCDTCSARAECERHGHDWSTPPAPARNPATLDGRDPEAGTRECRRCGQRSYTGPRGMPVPGHPEAIPLPTQNQRRLLAMLNDLYGGGEAR